MIWGYPWVPPFQETSIQAIQAANMVMGHNFNKLGVTSVIFREFHQHFLSQNTSKNPPVNSYMATGKSSRNSVDFPCLITRQNCPKTEPGGLSL